MDEIMKDFSNEKRTLFSKLREKNIKKMVSGNNGFTNLNMKNSLSARINLSEGCKNFGNSFLRPDYFAEKNNYECCEMINKDVKSILSGSLENVKNKIITRNRKLNYSNFVTNLKNNFDSYYSNKSQDNNIKNQNYNFSVYNKSLIQLESMKENVSRENSKDIISRNNNQMLLKKIRNHSCIINSKDINLYSNNNINIILKNKNKKNNNNLFKKKKKKNNNVLRNKFNFNSNYLNVFQKNNEKKFSKKEMKKFTNGLLISSYI